MIKSVKTYTKQLVTFDSNAILSRHVVCVTHFKCILIIRQNHYVEGNSIGATYLFIRFIYHFTVSGLIRDDNLYCTSVKPTLVSSARTIVLTKRQNTN